MQGFPVRQPWDSQGASNRAQPGRITVDILTQFLYRLAFGIATAMALTSPRWVTSGYFRVHLYVILGLDALAAAVALSRPGQFSPVPAVAGAVLAYVGSACWLYEARGWGRASLVLTSAAALVGAWLSLGASEPAPSAPRWLWLCDPPAGGMVLGTTMAAMLLGHWYLNTPTMKLDPLRRLIALMLAALAVRGLLCLAALGMYGTQVGPLASYQMLFLALRWLAGLVGTAVVAIMAWQTLKIPNTQSATGILYVGVITTLLGELTAQLLAAEVNWPL